MNRCIYMLLAMTLFGGCAKTHAVIATPSTAAEISNPRIHFPFDSDYLLPKAIQETDENINWLKKNTPVYLILEGHCDKIGPDIYNMELGDRRARAVKAYMMEHGIPDERIVMIISYGSTHPLNLGHAVEDLRENRRVEFVIR